MIYDCTMFNREFDVLELRMKLLERYVDHFVVVQANKTHDGADRRYEDLEDVFPSYANKIISVYCELPTIDQVEGDRFVMDRIQRLNIHQVQFQPDDLVLIGDVDEIPDMTTWIHQEGVFQQRHSYYKFDLVDPRPWNGTCIVLGWRFNNRYGNTDAQQVRNFRDLLRPVGTGWHFGWLSETILNAQMKANNCAHDELDLAQVAHNYLTMHPMDNTQLIQTHQYLPIQCYDYPQYFHKLEDKQ